MALNDDEIAVIKGMLARGDRQSDIASFFGGENSGRISEINTGKRGAHISAASSDALPPAGPYLAARSGLKARQTLEAMRDLINDVLSEIDDWETRK